MPAAAPSPSSSSSLTFDTAAFEHKPEMRKANAALLASGYTWQKRLFECITMSLFFFFLGLAVINVVEQLPLSHSLIVPLALLCANLSSDFISGHLHWTFDTWGYLSTPIFGPTFIRSFREHHIAPTAMCTHDFIEANADAMLLSWPMLAYISSLSLPAISAKTSFVLCWTIGVCFISSLTNQLHKWAHERSPPSLVRFAQQNFLVLEQRHHSIHHQPPFDVHYCITVGWLNRLLDRVGYWRAIEWPIARLTGAKARADDAIWTKGIYRTTSF